MNSIRNIARLNDLELQKVTPSNASWHTDYRDTAYIHIGGLPFELSEGDILLICSQYGNPTHVNLVRDKDTGKSRGFAFLKYEDQRSTDLAVDNLSGAQVLGRTLSVDHARYKMKDGERETVGDSEEEDEVGEGGRRKKRRKSESESESEERPMIKEEVELAKLMQEHDGDDPMKAYMVQAKKDEVQEALSKVVISKPKRREGERHKHHHHHRSRREGSDEDDKDRRRNGHRPRHRDSNDEGSEVGESRSRPQRSSRRIPSASPDPDELPRRRKRPSRSEDDDFDQDDRRRRRMQNGNRDNETRRDHVSSRDSR